MEFGVFKEAVLMPYMTFHQVGCAPYFFLGGWLRGLRMGLIKVWLGKIALLVLCCVYGN